LQPETRWPDHRRGLHPPRRNEDHDPEAAADATDEIHQPCKRGDVAQHEKYRGELTSEQPRRQCLIINAR
jgi:hypothetical protein